MPRNVRAVRAGRVRSQLKGVAGVRKLIRQLPPSAKQEMAAILEDVRPDYLAAVEADAPVRTGALKAALSAKVLKASLRLRVGLIGRRANLDFFYGRILELGRKAQTVLIKHGPRAGSQMHVGAIEKRPFVYKKRAALRQRLNARLNRFWEHALGEAALGTDLDD